MKPIVIIYVWGLFAFAAWAFVTASVKNERRYRNVKRY
jgi:hypothetical protein